MADTADTTAAKRMGPGPDTSPMNLTCAAASVAVTEQVTGGPPPPTYSAFYIAIDTTGNTPAAPSDPSWERVVGPGANGAYDVTFNGQSLNANGNGVIVYGKP